MGVRIEIDIGACAGCGTCVSLCPEVFELKDEKAWVKVQGEEAEKLCDLDDVAFQCPVGAITIVRD
ncbi:MAG: ferredoxin [Candidatus Baldrarchaeia archaeon]